MGPLCTAILAHADDQLEAALLRRPNAFEERTFEGYNRLHLAGDWPHGIQLLLKNGASSLFNELDHWRGSALDHAIKAGNAQSIMLLLDGGCLAADERNLNWRNLSSYCQGNNAGQAIKATVEVLVTRRRALRAFALVHFPQSLTGLTKDLSEMEQASAIFWRRYTRPELRCQNGSRSIPQPEEPSLF